MNFKVYLHWFHDFSIPNIRAAEGIKIINQLDDDVFQTVISYVHKNMSPDDEENKDDDDPAGLEELEHMVNVERKEFLLLIKTLSYILKRTSTFLMKPTKLQSELKEKLQLNDGKVDAIMKIWVKYMKPRIDNMQIGSDGHPEEEEESKNNELKCVNWNIKTELSSQAKQKKKTVIGELQLMTTHGDPTVLVMNRTELTYLYKQLELIQNELDSLRNK